MVSLLLLKFSFLDIGSANAKSKAGSANAKSKAGSANAKSKAGSVNAKGSGNITSFGVCCNTSLFLSKISIWLMVGKSNVSCCSK